MGTEASYAGTEKTGKNKCLFQAWLYLSYQNFGYYFTHSLGIDKNKGKVDPTSIV